MASCVPFLGKPGNKTDVLETPIGKPQSGAAKSFRKLRDLLDLNSPNRLQTAFWLKINELGLHTSCRGNSAQKDGRFSKMMERNWIPRSAILSPSGAGRGRPHGFKIQTQSTSF